MIITNVELLPCKMPKKDPKWRFALSANPVSEGWILCLEADGGVRGYGYASATEVDEGYEAISANVAARQPGTALDGMLVAKQIEAGLELVLGVSRDPEMGPVVMFGTGGVWLIPLWPNHKYTAVDSAELGPAADRRETMAPMIGRTG